MANQIFEKWREAQKCNCYLPCPRCGKNSMNINMYQNALSRRANIYICSDCGTSEALEEFDGYTQDISGWWVFKRCFDVPMMRSAVLTDENIDDIMSSALDGGISYWCRKVEVVEDEYLGEYSSEQIARGGSLRLYDAEEDTVYTLTKEMLVRGLQLAYKNGYANSDHWVKDGFVDTGEIDAVDADVIVQCAIFEDVIYG